MRHRHPARRPHHPRRDESGVILVLTLVVVALLVVLAHDTANVARMEIEATMNNDSELKVSYALKGGYQLATAHLRQDLVENEIDSLQDTWAVPEGLTYEFNPLEAGAPSLPGVGRRREERHPSVRVFIHDESGKWPLNVLLINTEAYQRKQLEGLATVIDSFRENTNLDVSTGQADQYAELIYRFIKRKEDEGGFGPTPRPQTKTGSLLRVTDLALIPGIPPALIYDQVDQQTVSEHQIAPGLMHFVTLWSDLQINLNTASLPVLRGIFTGKNAHVGDDIFKKRGESYEELARERSRLEATRQPAAGSGEEEEELAAGPFEDIEDAKEAVNTLTNDIYNSNRTMMCVSSNAFSIWVEARLGNKGPRRIRRWVVRRDGPRIIPVLAEEVNYPWLRRPTEEEREEGRFGR